MDQFVSHYMLRLDAKGRVSVPATFRAVLTRDGFDGLFVIPRSTGRHSMPAAMRFSPKSKC